MRRRLAVLLTALVVMALGVAAAPPATAANLPPGEYLWATTATQTLVYDRSQLTPVLVAQTTNNPTGGLARSIDQFGDWVFVTTTGGIQMFDATTGQPIQSFTADSNGYQQVAAVPSLGGTTVYGLRTGGAVVDVFLAANQSLVTSITLRGPATYMSSSPPAGGAFVALGGIVDAATGAYLTGALDTSDNSVDYLSAGARQVVNGAVWSPDGSRAYLTVRNLDSATGSIGTLVPPQAYANTATAVGVTPQQLAISTDGSRLYAPATDAAGHASIQILDASTRATVAIQQLGLITTFGVPALAPDGKLYLPPGTGGVSDLVVLQDTKGGEPVPISIGAGNAVAAVLVADLPSAVHATSGASQQTYIDQPFDAPVVVTVVDSAGTPLPGQLVRFTSPDIDAVHFVGCAICLAYTGADGTAISPPIVAGSTPGPVNVVASVTGTPDVTFPLSVLPLPTPPTITALAAGDGSVGVTFTPGDDRGISPPSGFTVTATDITTPANGGQTAQGPTSPITVTGLTNADTYTFNVTANTPKGDWTSAPSQRINAGVPSSITGRPPSGVVQKGYHYRFTVTGAPTPTVTLLVGSLPDGLAFDAATATISGVPTTAGSTYLLFLADNGVGTSQDEFTLDILPAGSLGEPVPPTPTVATSPTSSAPAAGSGSPPPASSAAANRPLAATGMPVGQLVGGAAVLFVAGGGLLVLSRRRRTVG